MASTIPYFAEPARAPVKRGAARVFSAVQMLGAVGFIAGAVGGVASGLDAVHANGSLDVVLLWAVLTGASAIVWTLGVVETRILAELRKPLDR